MSEPFQTNEYAESVHTIHSAMSERCRPLEPSELLEGVGSVRGKVVLVTGTA